MEQLRKSNNPVSEADTIVLQEEKRIAIRKTPAQIAFEKMQEKRVKIFIYSDWQVQ